MRQRGFEKISFGQWLKDYWDMTVGDYEKIWDKHFMKKVDDSYSQIVLPKRATSHSAGYDVYSTKEFTLLPDEDINIPVGWKTYMLADEKLMFYPRSGLGFKYYIRLANTTGIIDSDYYNNEGNEGHCWVKIRNEGDKVVEIKEGMGIAQCVFEKYLLADYDTFEGNKRIGGFGSTSE